MPLERVYYGSLKAGGMERGGRYRFAPPWRGGGGGSAEHGGCDEEQRGAPEEGCMGRAAEEARGRQWRLDEAPIASARGEASSSGTRRERGRE